MSLLPLKRRKVEVDFKGGDIFSTLTEVRDITEKWLIEYNDERPHESLGDLSPWAFLAKQNDRMNSNNSWH